MSVELRRFNTPEADTLLRDKYRGRRRPDGLASAETAYVGVLLGACGVICFLLPSISVPVQRASVPAVGAPSAIGRTAQYGRAGRDLARAHARIPNRANPAGVRGLRLTRGCAPALARRGSRGSAPGAASVSDWPAARSGAPASVPWAARAAGSGG